MYTRPQTVNSLLVKVLIATVTGITCNVKGNGTIEDKKYTSFSFSAVMERG